MKNRVASLLFVGLFGSLASCETTKDAAVQKIILTNTSPLDLAEKAIAIDRASLTGMPEGELYPLLLSLKGDTIPAQLDDLDGDNKWDELFFVKDLPANQQETVQLKWLPAPVQFEKRTSVRFGVRSSMESKVHPASSDTFYAHELPGVMGYQPYQTDGPSWENDKVGFRHYLDGRNSKDVFGKKVSYMSPDSVGLNQEGVTKDNYHFMEDWGRDILSVGNSVGIGGMALMIGDKLARLGVTEADTRNNVDSTFFQILSEGPVRSVINYKYHNWMPLNRNYNVEETTSIWPGMYAYKNSVRFSDLQGDETLLVGLVNSQTDQPLTEVLTHDNFVILLTHDQQTYNKEWWLGLALILPKDIYLGYMEAPKTGSLSNTYLAKLAVQNKRAVDYYAVACWELRDEGFRDPGYFKEYVNNLVEQLSAEVKVLVNN